MPTAGSELVACVALSNHAVERFARRGFALDEGVDPRARLLELLETEGQPTRRAPGWYSGSIPEFGFCIRLARDSAILIATPTRPERGRENRMWVATTFVCQAFSADDVKSYTPKDVRRLLSYSADANRTWRASRAIRDAPNKTLADALRAAQFTLRPPEWISRTDKRRDRIYALIGDVVVMIGRRPGHIKTRRPLHAIRVFDREYLKHLRGDELITVIELERATLHAYREKIDFTSDDARHDLSTAIQNDGEITFTPPAWAARINHPGPVLMIGEDVAIELRIDLDAPAGGRPLRTRALKTRPKPGAATPEAATD